MEDHYQLTDEAFEKRFASLSLDPSLFTHEAHLRLAWINIHKYGIHKAIQDIRSQIRAFATAQGAEMKYHDTITVAAVRAVYHFYLKSESNNFREFIRANPRLMHNFKDLLNSHYSWDFFSSAQARHEFIEPDLLPFDDLPKTAV